MRCACLPVLALAGVTGAQDLIVVSKSDVVTSINDVMPVGDGTAYVTSGDGELWLVDLADFSASLEIAGLPMSAPGRGQVVTGHPWLDDGLLLADWNSETDAACCDGSTWIIDTDTLAPTLLIEGNPVTNVGDPIAAAVAPGGVWGDDVYVLDFQGASPEEPLIFRVTEGGALPFLQDAALWSTNDTPTSLVFDTTGGYAGDLFVVESFTTPEVEAIRRVEPDASWSTFFSDPALGEPRDIAFGGPGDFGASMFVLFELDGNGAVYEISPAGVSTFVVDGLCDAGQPGEWALAYDASTDSLVAGTGDVLHVISFGGAPCYPDCDGNGALNILDFVCFQAAFVAGKIEADCNRDCAFTILDFVCFQNSFVAGCP